MKSAIESQEQFWNLFPVVNRKNTYSHKLIGKSLHFLQNPVPAHKPLNPTTYSISINIQPAYNSNSKQVYRITKYK